MTNHSEVVTLIDTYCEAWREPDESRRAGMLQDVLTATVTYTDPTVHAEGIAALTAHITRVLARRPGSRVIRTSQVDEHHGMTRFAWRAVEADGKELPEGIDIVFLSADGSRIEKIIGFFGPVKRDATCVE